jgi:RHS repeat-associated protein
VVELLDANGNPFAAYRYDAWGNPLGEGNVGAGLWSQGTTGITAELATTIAERQVLRYAGYCFDSESGMYYLSARHYDPATRQFLSKDLSRNDGEQSAYGYCLGNPVFGTDPSGYRPLFETGSRETDREALKRWSKQKAEEARERGPEWATKAHMSPLAPEWMYLPWQDMPPTDLTAYYNACMRDCCANIKGYGGRAKAMLVVLYRIQVTHEWDPLVVNAGPVNLDALVANIGIEGHYVDRHYFGNFWAGVMFSALEEPYREMAIEASLLEAQVRAKNVLESRYPAIRDGDLDPMAAYREYFDALDHEAWDQSIIREGVKYGLTEIMPYVDYCGCSYWFFK